MDSAPPVDFHCHLDLYPDLGAAYDYCARSGCITLAVTTTPQAFDRNRRLASSIPHVHAALGLHPQLVAERAHEIALFESLAAETRFVGEVGLDAGRHHYASFELQQSVFERALSLCREHGRKIISTHSVRCARQVLDALERTQVVETCSVVLHWFSASRSEIERARELDCWFSVNERLLATKPGQRLLDIVPPERLLTETDGPFIEVGDRPIRAGEVERAIKLIANHYRRGVLETQAAISRNAAQLLSLHDG